MLLQHIQAPYGQAWIISAKNYSQTSGKISYFGHPFSTGKGMLCCKETHTLMLECFITFLRCIWMLTGSSGSIYKHRMAKSVLFLPKTTIKFQENIRNWAPSQHWKGDDVLQRDIFIATPGIQNLL